MTFRDRVDAGRQLADALKKFEGKKGAVLLGLPRGGVVTAAEIAEVLGLPVDVVVTRKIGAPGNPEFAIGAITETGEGVFDQDIIRSYRISKKYIKDAVETEKKEAERRLKVYRGDRKPIDLEGKTVILVDDGVATGSTMRAAVRSVKGKGVREIVVAVPVISHDSLKDLKKECNEVIFLDAPRLFFAVGQFYEVFDQTSDDEVVEIMKKL